MRLNAQRSSRLGDFSSETRAQGRVKVKGKAGPGKHILKAPLSGRSCVFYSVDVGEWFNGTKTPLLEEKSDAAFRIDDSTGTALVDPSGAETYLRQSLVQGHSSDYLSEHRTLLKRHGFGMVDEYGELRSLAFRETIIAPGDTIIALGSIRYEADPNGIASYREQPQQPVLGSEANQPLLLSQE
jgi:hypothetical protein